MSNLRGNSLAFILILIVFWVGCGSVRITPTEAMNYVGLTRTVEGDVTSAEYFPQLKGRPTFLNLGKQPYPHHDFTIVIWEEDRKKFSVPPELKFANRKVAVMGLIKIYRGKPEIVLRNPADITIR